MKKYTKFICKTVLMVLVISITSISLCVPVQQSNQRDKQYNPLIKQSNSAGSDNRSSSALLKASLLKKHANDAFIHQQQTPKKNPSKLVIGCRLGTTGLFAAFIGALNNIAWCDKHKVLPVVYWGKGNCTYYEEGAYDGIKNAWEYYFEPVSSATYQPGDKVRKGFFDKDKNGIYLLRDKGKTYAQKPFRRDVNAVIQKYIKLKPHVSHKVNNFYEQHMVGKKTIGIHVRGTDKYTEVAPVKLENVWAEANKEADIYGDCQFLVATDEIAILEEAKKHLQRPVIYYDAFRSSNGKALHNQQQPYSKALLGEEVVIEVQLLSKCAMLLHTCSNVSFAVLFFNPEMDSILLN